MNAAFESISTTAKRTTRQTRKGATSTPGKLDDATATMPPPKFTTRRPVRKDQAQQQQPRGINFANTTTLSNAPAPATQSAYPTFQSITVGTTSSTPAQATTSLIDPNLLNQALSRTFGDVVTNSTTIPSQPRSEAAEGPTPAAPDDEATRPSTKTPRTRKKPANTAGSDQPSEAPPPTTRNSRAKTLKVEASKTTEAPTRKPRPRKANAATTVPSQPAPPESTPGPSRTRKKTPRSRDGDESMTAQQPAGPSTQSHPADTAFTLSSSASGDNVGATTPLAPLMSGALEVEEEENNDDEEGNEGTELGKGKRKRTATTKATGPAPSAKRPKKGR
ncbi:MAG: hypothetical protein Q9222_005587 [Ikaeria aurantiellina]